MGRGAPLLLVLALVLAGSLAWLVLAPTEPARVGRTVPAPSAASASGTIGGGATTAPSGTALSPAVTRTPAEQTSTTVDPGRTAGDPGPVLPAGAGPATGDRSDETPLPAGEALVSGRVRPAGAPRAEARVALLRADGRAVAEGRAGADGAFRLTAPTAADLRLVVTDEGAFPLVRPLGALAVGQRLDLGNLPLVRGTWRRIEVRDGADRVPDGVLGYTTTGPLGHREPLVAQQDGSWLALVPSGGRVCLAAPGFLPVIDLAAPGSGDEPLLVRLAPGVRATVALRDGADEPLAGARVTLVPDRHAGQLVAQRERGLRGRAGATLEADLDVLVAETGPTGEARFDQLDSGGYVVLADHPEHLGDRVGFLAPTELPEHPPLVGSLAPAPRLHLVVRVAAAEEAGAAGSVTEDAGDGQAAGPAGLRVGALLEDGVGSAPTWLDAAPDAAGRVDLVLPREGAWWVEAWAPGFHLAAVPASPTTTAPEPGEDDERRQVLDLEPVEGPGLLVLDPAGDPVPGAALAVTMASERRARLGLEPAAPWRRAWASEDLAGLALAPPGDGEAATWTVTAPGYEPLAFGSDRWAYETTVATDREGRPWVLTLDRGVDLLVVVADGAGRPVAGATVYLTHGGGETPRPVTTGADGHARWDQLARGEVTAKARGPAGSISDAATGELDPAAGGFLRLDLTLD